MKQSHGNVLNTGGAPIHLTRVLLKVLKGCSYQLPKNINVGTCPLFLALKKDMGWGVRNSAPPIPTTLRKVNFDNFRGPPIHYYLPCLLSFLMTP